MKKKLIIIGSIVLSFIILVGVIILISILAYFNSLKKLNNNTKLRPFVVESGNTYYSIIDDLYEQKFIKSELGFKIYLKLHKPENKLDAGEYYLSSSMSVKEILRVLSSGGKSVNDNVSIITIVEGLNMRKLTKVIEENTSIKADDVYDLLEDEEYLDYLIGNYWFLTDEIKNPEIYYSLEGYLHPDTYQIENDITAKKMIEMLLDYEELVLNKYKEDIEKSNYTVHELITLASIVELEGKTKEDRIGVASVFYNRLNNNMALGSDVTTYYAAKVDMSERDLYLAEVNDYNAYNTRNDKMAGKLPVGPISNPSEDSLYAVLYPKESNNFYFVSDKNGKVYFAKNYNEHLSVIAELKDQGLWYTY